MSAQSEKRKPKETPKKDNVTPLPRKVEEKVADHIFCGPHMKLPPVTVTDESVPLADRTAHRSCPMNVQPGWPIRKNIASRQRETPFFPEPGKLKHEPEI